MTQLRSDIQSLLHPDGVVLVGGIDRSSDPDTVLRGYANLWGNRVYLVSPKGGSVGDVPVYQSVAELPDFVTLAVLSVPAKAVPSAVADCGKKGIPFVLIFSAGFSEASADGESLERELADEARKYGIRVLGPNTMTSTFERMPVVPGLEAHKVGLLTHSGHLFDPLIRASQFGFAFSRMVTTGNEADLEAADFLEYFAYDDETQVIAAYFEGFRDGTKLRKALAAAQKQQKPIVALKVGRTGAGTRMARSHTAHLTGSDAVVDGLFHQYGVVRVDDLDEVLETSALFAKLPSNTGRGVCCYSISGGSSSLMAEIAEQNGVVLPALSQDTQDQIHEFIPSFLSVANPIDSGGRFNIVGSVEDRWRVLELIAADPAIDLLLVAINAPVPVDPVVYHLVEDVLAFHRQTGFPLVMTWNSLDTTTTNASAFQAIIESGVPLFRTYGGCFGALRRFFDHQDGMSKVRDRSAASVALPPAASEILNEGGVLATEAGRQLLGMFDVPLAEQIVAGSSDQAAAAAQSLGFPVVMKIASPDIPHRSDAGLVHLGVADPESVRAVYERLLQDAAEAEPDALIEGVLLQHQHSGVELIVGLTYDVTLGAAVTVGAGGIFAEILADVAVRPLPLDREDVDEMLRSLQIFPLLDGARGRARVDIEKLTDMILAVARLGAACGSAITELDLNPVVVSETGVAAVDYLVVAGEPAMVAR